MQAKSASDGRRPSEPLTIRTVLDRAVQPVDAASVVLFRILFGAIMAGWAWDYLASGRVTTLYVQPAFHFSYYGLEWLQPWPGNGMYFHFLALVVLALCISAGLFYRVSSLLFAIAFTYFFLLERTNYQNHYYLIALFTWWLPWLPLNRLASVDALRRGALVSQTVPAWTLWVLLFHTGMPYLYGGFAKLTADWLLGQPMSIMLAAQADWPVLGSWLAWAPMGWILSWSGMLFDLLVVPALLIRRLRVGAYVCCLVFHISNSLLFQIHVFPWFMIAATTLFFAPDWPRRIMQGREFQPLSVANHNAWNWTLKRSLTCVAIGAYLAFQVTWPFRHRLYDGNASWNERGHQFAWRMMLRGKEVGLGYALQDPQNGRVVNVQHTQFLAPEQAEKFPRDPEMILHLAHYIADKFESDTGRRPAVYAFALASLNGRKPQLMIDPNQDLASVPRGIYFNRPWVPKLSEPLRDPPWDIPVQQWSQHVELPEIAFLSNSPSSPNDVAVPGKN